MAEASLTDMVTALETFGPPPETRDGLDTASLIAAQPELEAVDTTDQLIKGPHGDIPARLYRHRDNPRGEALVWAHGGAWITGSIDQPEAHWVALSLAAAGITVLSTSYRKALHGMHFPVPSDDVYAAWKWAVQNADELGVDPGRIHVGGASAGANLAAGTSVRSTLSNGQTPASVVLVYPLVHALSPQYGLELQESLARLAPKFNFTPEVVDALTDHYAGQARLTDPVAFAGNANAAVLANQPATLILNAEADELRASGEEFAKQLVEAGVRVQVTFQTDTYHGFLDDPTLPAARSALSTIATWITADSKQEVDQ